jgi:Mce-associated membrane protein
MSPTVSEKLSKNGARSRPSPKPRPEDDVEPAAADQKSPTETEADKKSEPPADSADEISVGQAFRRLFRGLRPSVGLRTVAVVVLIVALAAVAAYFGWQNYTKAASTSAQASALAAARTYATDLSTYDYRSLSGNFKKVTANSTGEFGQQYGKVSQNLTKLIQQYHATSKGTVIRAGISEATSTRVVVVLFVDQQITNTNSPQPRVDRNRMQMVLVKADDRWQISNVALL